MKRLVAVFAAVLLCVVLSASFTTFAAPPPPDAQPEMRTALDHLREAKRALESASHDKGGHRAKAISYINQAIAQVEEGVRYDNTHTSGREAH